MTIPVRDMLLRFAGSFPITDDGLFNTIEMLEETQNYPAPIAINAARFPMRVVGALLPDTDSIPAMTVAMLCGQHHIMFDPRIDSVFRAYGEWDHESSPQTIRRFIMDIAVGRHPEDAAEDYGLHQDELTFLEGLLHLEQGWHDGIMDRAIFAYENYRGLGRWVALSRELRTFRPDILLSWMRSARAVVKDLRSARAQPD
jgi:hypothetical protein